ncbi:LOW QUALITY PROTEIN: RNA polymerase sigma factor sigC-like [Salvia miltiorrhiza]|uniref:LOW QUALITY PROTEIN: RNA polymerase sigma factor sigC-like n=1 Tax=Salvia miltiorrhiza TaxID=226208 RepID=UPI0025AD3158|nr:LOW QUALITY PROTEIN: RNA polymerase sigma factor sigC-like [Salvia miltiorrhiza]
MGFRLNIKWGGLSVQSPLSTSSSSLPSSYSYRGRDSSCILARVSAASVLYSEAETQNDTSRAQVSSSSHQLLEKYFMETRELKVALGKGSGDSSVYRLLDTDTRISSNGENSTSVASSRAMQTSQYRLLMKNLDVLEYMFADSDVVRLERDILEQLERLGALRLFRSFQSRTLISSTSFDVSNAPTENVDELRANDSVENHAGKVVVRSGKKEVRKSRRNRALEKESAALQELPTEAFSNNLQRPKFALPRRNSRSRNKKLKIARNEAEMSSGVKMVAGLEKLRMMLERDAGKTPSLSSWAEAAGVERNELQRQLHYGWHCRGELLRSTRSLVLFIARNYWGLGVAFEDLIQAGRIGVLQGAERFDQSRGYKFSTYVQYWIRKSMSTLVARHARGVRIPCTLSKAINQVHKARKSLRRSNGKYPDDCEIAKFTGLTVAKIVSASKCLRVVGSINEKIGESTSTKYMEIIPDTSTITPKEAILRQHMIKDVHTLLNGLDSREREVIILRFGLGNSQCKSLEEIGRRFNVSKEWIRRIERAALTKLRNEESLKILNHYVYLSS